MPIRSPLRAGVLFLFVALVTLATDLWTKHWAESLAGPRAAVDGFARFVLAHNPGGAGSILHDAPEAVRLPLFILVTLAALGVLVAIYLRTPGTAARLGIALVAGGAIGNLVDRLRYGYVIDFIDLSARWRGSERHWPTFNVADVAICAGVGLLLLGSAASRWGPGERRAPPGAPRGH